MHALTLQHDDETEDPKDQVTLSTLHGAKGLEFDYVFLVGCEEGILPHSRTTDTKASDLDAHTLGSEGIDEERRLFYVGVTRAKKELVISVCKHRVMRGKPAPRTPSRFVLEIPETLVTPVEAKESAGISQGRDGSTVRRPARRVDGRLTMALYVAEDRIARMFREKTISRGFAVLMFLLVLYLFRNLWPVLVSFVLFEKGMGWLARKGSEKLGVPRTYLVVAMTLLMLGVLALVAYSSFEPVTELVNGAIDSLPKWQKEIRMNSLFKRLQRTFKDSDMIAEHLEGYATTALGMVSTVGRFFIQATIGFLLALVYLFEEESLAKFSARIAPKSLFGRLIRWTTHLADAIVVTVQLQLVVAVFNTVTTLPVLLVLGVPNVPALMVLVFVAALIPVLGNFVAGVVLCFFAFQAKGWVGVGIFLAVTALLGKVESYYLSPRLTARHVKMPSFVLVASLVAFEQLFGFAGFFLSFPFLFVAGRVRAEFQEEEGILPPRSIRPNLALGDDLTAVISSVPVTGELVVSTVPAPIVQTAKAPVPQKTLQSEVNKTD